MCIDIELRNLSTVSDGDSVCVTGELRGIQLKRTKHGEDWGALEVAKGDATVTVLVFPRTFAAIDRATLVPDAAVRVIGGVYRPAGGVPRIAASRVERLRV